MALNLDELNKVDSNMKVSNQYFTEDEILKSGGIIYDPSRAGESGPSELPDVNHLLDTVTRIMEYMCTDELQALKAEDEEKYEFNIEDKFPEFTSKYYSLFKMIIEGEDLTPMYKMFACIDMVNKGQSSLEDVEKRLGEELAEEYVKPMTDGDKQSSDADDEQSSTDPAKKKRKRNNKKKKRKK